MYEFELSIYEKLWKTKYKKESNFVRKYLGRAVTTIIDIGCGTGGQ